MIKTLKTLFKQDKERFVVPKGVQDVIPIKAIFDDGIFQVGKDKYSKSYKFTDIKKQCFLNTPSRSILWTAAQRQKLQSTIAV